MQLSRPRAAHDGDARLIVERDNADAVRAVNRVIGSDDDRVRRSNPDATPAPRATDILAVYDLDSQAYHFILLYRLDHRPPPAPVRERTPSWLLSRDLSAAMS